MPETGVRQGPDILLLVRTGLLLAVLGVDLGGFLQDIVAAVRYPFGLDFGEGIVWQQAMLIPGPRMYERAAGLPMIVFNYPPVFYLLVHGVEALGWDGLAAGRIVAGLSTLAMGVLVTVLVLLCTRRTADNRMRVLLAIAAGAMLVGLDAVRNWGLVARVDMPGVALALAGLVVACRADGRFAGTVVALLLCLAAVFTKQTLLASGIAVVLMGLVRRPVATAGAAVVVGAIGIGLLVWLQGLTDGGFLANILGNNLNRMSLDEVGRILALETMILPQVLLMLAAAGLLASGIWMRSSGRPLAAMRAMAPVEARQVLMLVHFALSATSLIAIAKIGSNFNYLIEWLASGTVVLGIWLVGLGMGRVRLVALAVLIVAFVASPFRVMPNRADAADLAVKTALVARIAAASQPVASEEMTLLLRAGKQVTFEPAIVTELALVGRWDEAPLVAMMQAGGFAFVLTSEGGPSRPIDEPPPSMRRCSRPIRGLRRSRRCCGCARSPDRGPERGCAACSYSASWRTKPSASPLPRKRALGRLA